MYDLDWLYEMYTSRYRVYKQQHRNVAMERMMSKMELEAAYTMLAYNNKLNNNQIIKAIVEEQRVISKGMSRSLHAAFPDLSYSDIVGDKIPQDKLDDFYDIISQDYHDMINQGVIAEDAKKAISQIYFGSL